MTRKSGRGKGGRWNKKQTGGRRLRALADGTVAEYGEPLSWWNGPIGWWDYDETDRPTLVNRFSGERLRMGRTVRIARRLRGQRWIRLDYRHDDLRFPVVVCWMPEQGHIVVDYLASAALWREETGGKHRYPPYGTWVRLDDCVMDAIWCWPGVLAALHRDSRRPGGPEEGAVGFIGGWCNGDWRPDFLRVTTPLAGPKHVTEYFADNKPSHEELEVHLPLRQLMPLEEPAPSPWTFIDAASYEEHERHGYTHFEGFKLVHVEGTSKVVKPHPYQLPEHGSESVTIDGTVPHMRARDGSRVIYPLSARLHLATDRQNPERILGPSHGSIRYACLEAGLSGVLGGWTMPENFPGSREFDTGRLQIGIGLRGLTLRRSDGGEYQVVDRMKLGWSEQTRAVDYESHGPWVLSAESIRRHTRLVQDARLFWQGTEQRPECWSVVSPELLSYRGQGTVTIRSGLLGGTLLGYDIHARLGDDRPWTIDGFTLGPFMSKA